MVGIKMKNKDDIRIRQLLEEEHTKLAFIIKTSYEKFLRITFSYTNNRVSGITINVKNNHLKYIKLVIWLRFSRTQFRPNSKLKIKHFCPYKVISVKSNNSYEVVKVGHHEGPNITSTEVDMMKPWSTK